MKNILLEFAMSAIKCGHNSDDSKEFKENMEALVKNYEKKIEVYLKRRDYDPKYN